MEFQKVSERAMKVREMYAQLERDRYGKEWSTSQIAEGFVGDVGDLMKLVLAKDGVRNIEDMDEKLEHEVADCLWSVLVLAREYDIDLEKAFLSTMDNLEEKIQNKLSNDL